MSISRNKSLDVTNECTNIKEQNDLLNYSNNNKNNKILNLSNNKSPIKMNKKIDANNSKNTMIYNIKKTNKSVSWKNPNMVEIIKIESYKKYTFRNSQISPKFNYSKTRCYCNIF